MKRIQEYLEKVLAQVRVKKIRPILGRELEDHLLLQTRDYQAQGMEEEQAQQQAIDALVTADQAEKLKSGEP